MSIIHEALKKAEREREPRPRGLPLNGGGRPVRQRWRRSVPTGMLIALTVVVAAVCIWLWLQSPGGPSSAGTAVPMPQYLPMVVREDGAQAAQQAAATSPMLRAQPTEATRLWTSDEFPSQAALVPLTPEVQATVEDAFERARAAEVAGQWEEATRYYRQALALNPTLVEARNNLGTLYVHQQRLTAAIREFQGAVRLDPSSAVVRNNLGSAYFLMGEEALAIREFLAALHIDGTYVSPLYNLASLYARRGDVGQAVAFLTRAMAIEPAVLSWVQEDADFDGIKATKEFQRLRGQHHTNR
jgi:tetratricopeptide (TPR) repeat protein